MNREIKFRAWNNKNKEMLYGNNGLFMFVGTGLLGWNFADTFDWPANEFTLMQYTEMKDKNDREIYVGDIMANELNPNGFVVESLYVAYEMWRAYEAMSNSKDWKVIGNIYENPELLTNK